MNNHSDYEPVELDDCSFCLNHGQGEWKYRRTSMLKYSIAIAALLAASPLAVAEQMDRGDKGAGSQLELCGGTRTWSDERQRLSQRLRTGSAEGRRKLCEGAVARTSQRQFRLSL